MANRAMLALLGLLAVAGYQNRDKIGAALNNLQSGTGGGLGGLGGGLGNVLGGPATGSGGLGGLLAGLGGGGLAGGLTDLLNSFRSAGHGDTAETWIKPGVPTQGLTPQQVEEAVGGENLDELAKRTGLTRQELLQRLATAIPETVDKLTPEGQMPTEEEARQRLGVPLGGI
jgi:uncharacterized protein YidB (DUF937 family)